MYVCIYPTALRAIPATVPRSGLRNPSKVSPIGACAPTGSRTLGARTHVERNVLHFRGKYFGWHVLMSLVSRCFEFASSPSFCDLLVIECFPYRGRCPSWLALVCSVSHWFELVFIGLHSLHAVGAFVCIGLTSNIIYVYIYIYIAMCSYIYVYTSICMHENTGCVFGLHWFAWVWMFFMYWIPPVWMH